MANYTDQDNIENLLSRDLTDAEVALLPIILDSIDAFINDELGGAYGSVSESTKYYDGGTKYLDIDSCKDITSIKSVASDESEIYDYDLDEDLESRPRNETIKNWIESRIGAFPSGVANIEVTAKFTLGDDVPSDIEYLATYMASKYFGEAVTGELKKESIEGYSREWKEYKMTDNFVSSTLNKYKKDDFCI